MTSHAIRLTVALLASLALLPASAGAFERPCQRSIPR